ncbi:MAG: DUF3352 domain-containing protein [Vulcanimicrobiota bacterium]
MKKQPIKVSFLILTAIFFMTSVCWAQSVPFDKNTEVFYEVNLSFEDINNILTDSYKRFQKIEPLRPYFDRFENEYEFDVSKEIVPWLGNKVMFGIMGEGSKSTLRQQIIEIMEYKKAVNDLKQTVSDINEINYSVSDALVENNELPPASQVIPDYMTPPRGGKYVYRRLPENRYEITVPEGQFKDLGLEGQAPVYIGDEGMQKDEPAVKKSYELKNFLLAISVKDSTLARNFFNKLEEKMGRNEVTFKKVAYGMELLKVSPDFSYTFIENYVMISDNPEILKKGISAFKNEKKSVLANEVYRDFVSSAPVFQSNKEKLFVNLDRIGVNSQLFEMKKGNKNVKSFLDALYYLGYATGIEKDGIEGSLILSLNPDKKVPVMNTFSQKQTISSEAIMERVPAGLPMLQYYSLGNVWGFIQAIAEEDEMFAQNFNQVNSMIGMGLNMDMQEQILPAIGGQLTVTYKARDFLLAAIIDVARGNRDVLKNIPETMDPMKLSPRYFNKSLTMKNVPITLFFMVEDREVVEGLLERMVGDKELTKEYYKDWVIYHFGSTSYCLTDEILVLHTTKYDVMVKEYLDKMLVKRERLAETTHYRDFKEKILGRPIAIQYQNTEWSASMAKGFLLFFLPEFSDYADMLADYDETWSAFSVAPDAFVTTFKMYKNKEEKK